MFDYSAPGGSGGYVGRCTAPLLVDRQRLKAVSQDSEEIVRMIATAEVWDLGLLV
jgi:glutathionyl-hydroquinone reductase